jgi:hypothetical protein
MSHDPDETIPYAGETASQRIDRLRTEAQEELEQGGVWHADGILPCATGQPYPHNNTPECRMIDRPTNAWEALDQAVQPVIAQAPGFELPTTETLRRQIDELTADRQALQTVITELQAELGDTTRRSIEVINDWDQRLRQTARERDELHGSLTVTDRALRRLHTAASALVDALDEGDIDTIGRIERVREALGHHEQPDTRMTLTDKAKRALSGDPSSVDTGSVACITRESDKILPGADDHGYSLDKSDYSMPASEESSLPERYMMATIAHHKLGDLSRPEPNLALITGEDDEHWIGSWVEGLGYFNVRFPKATTRGLSPAELEQYDGHFLDVGASRYVIRIPREDGNQ